MFSPFLSFMEPTCEQIRYCYNKAPRLILNRQRFEAFISWTVLKSAEASSVQRGAVHQH